MDLSYFSMFRCNELMKYTLLQLSYEECSQVTDCFQNRLPMRDTLIRLRKSTICCVISVCLSVRPYAWKNWAPNGRIFMTFLLESIEKIQASLTCNKINGFFT
jgi:hypothetical protein